MSEQELKPCAVLVSKRLLTSDGKGRKEKIKILKETVSRAKNTRSTSPEVEKLVEALEWCQDVADGLYLGDFSQDAIRNQYLGISRHCTDALEFYRKSAQSEKASE